MGFINHTSILKGDNYGKWIKKVDLAFICGEVDEIITTPKPTEPPAPVRGESDTDTLIHLSTDESKINLLDPFAIVVSF